MLDTSARECSCSNQEIHCESSLGLKDAPGGPGGGPVTSIDSITLSASFSLQDVLLPMRDHRASRLRISRRIQLRGTKGLRCREPPEY